MVSAPAPKDRELPGGAGEAAPEAIGVFYRQIPPMARIRLDIPPVLPFMTDLDIRVTDLNYGGHLGNDRVLALVHEARARFLASIGASEKDAFGIGMAMVDAIVLFRSEGFLGDRVEIGVGVADISTRSWDFLYRLWLPERSRELALVKTGMVGFDYGTRKVAELPVPFRECLSAMVDDPGRRTVSVG